MIIVSPLGNNWKAMLQLPKLPKFSPLTSFILIHYIIFLMLWQSLTEFCLLAGICLI